MKTGIDLILVRPGVWAGVLVSSKGLTLLGSFAGSEDDALTHFVRSGTSVFDVRPEWVKGATPKLARKLGLQPRKRAPGAGRKPATKNAGREERTYRLLPATIAAIRADALRNKRTQGEEIDARFVPPPPLMFARYEIRYRHTKAVHTAPTKAEALERASAEAWRHAKLDRLFSADVSDGSIFLYGDPKGPTHDPYGNRVFAVVVGLDRVDKAAQGGGVSSAGSPAAD